MRKPVLGRGLAALLDTDEEYAQEYLKGENREADMEIEAANDGAARPPADEGGKAPDLLAVEKLAPNPGQPRKNFDEAALKELAASIAEHGIIAPIIAADSRDGTFLIIAGERRYRAALLAGLKEVPVIVKNYADQKRMEISLVENLQRADLNPLEEAAAYKNLMDFSGLSQEEVADKVGKNRSTVANALRLLKLPAQMQKSVESGKISAGHARALLSVSEAAAREKLHKEILAGQLSVREAESRASKAASRGPKAAAGRAPEIDAMVEKFINRLGTKVTLDGDLKRGRITIDYYSMEDLERLYEILGG